MRSPRIKTLQVLLAAVALVSTACIADDPDPNAADIPPGGSVEIFMSEFSYKPSQLSFVAGSTVRITLINNGNQAHEFMAGETRALAGGYDHDLLVVVLAGADGSGYTTAGVTFESDEHGDEAATDDHAEDAATDDHAEDAATDDHAEDAATDDHAEDAMTDEAMTDEEMAAMTDEPTDDHAEDAMTDDAMTDEPTHDHAEDGASDDHDEDAMTDEAMTDEEMAAMDGEPTDDHAEDAATDDHADDGASDDHDEDAMTDEAMTDEAMTDEEMAAMDGGGHAGHSGAAVTVQPGGRVELELHIPADATGDWELGCFIAGHYEAGMHGTITILAPIS